MKVLVIEDDPNNMLPVNPLNIMDEIEKTLGEKIRMDYDW